MSVAAGVEEPQGRHVVERQDGEAHEVWMLKTVKYAERSVETKQV